MLQTPALKTSFDCKDYSVEKNDFSISNQNKRVGVHEILENIYSPDILHGRVNFISDFMKKWSNTILLYCAVKCNHCRTK